jgi:hypothetical protein
MKLFFCLNCNQIFNLSHTYKECDGGHGGGQYVNNIDAKIWGDTKTVQVLGFANTTFGDAVRAQLKEGDSKSMMRYAGGLTPKGRDFVAFVIPDAAASIERVAERFDPIEVDIWKDL